MLKIDWLPLLIKTCVMVLYVAALCMLADFMLVVVLRLRSTGRASDLTSFFSAIMFPFLLGLMPFSPSPIGLASRVFFRGRKTHIGVAERIVIFALMALFVVLVNVLSELYRRSIQVQPYPFIYVAVSVFVFVALIFLIRNWRYIKWDARNASAEH